MSVTAGDFSPSDLMDVVTLATNVFADDARKADVTPYSGIAQIVLQNQNARFEILKDAEKDRDVKVIWTQNCSITADDDDDQCVVNGTEAGSDSKVYSITERRKVEFKVKREVFRTNELEYQQVVARQFAEALKALDEDIAAYVPTKLDEFRGTNAFLRGFTQTLTRTIIPAASWTPDLMAYFIQASIKNKLGSVYLASGDLMYVQGWKAMMEQANGEGKGNANKVSALPIYHDLFNIDSTLGASSLFMINPSSCALVTKARYSSVPVEMPKIQQTRFKIPSPSLPGVEYDVIYTQECDSDDIIDKWKIVARYEMFQNPLGCTATRTGILEFRCS